MGFDLREHVERIERDGYTVIEDFLSASTLQRVRDALAPYLDTHSGRNAFEGFRTERVYTLVARDRVFWEIVLDARVLALCDHFLLPNYLLTASQAIRINPGEAAQAFHHDDSFYHLPRPRPMISLSTIVAVDAFTEANGGTQIVPGSHRWGDEKIEQLVAFRGAPRPEDEAPIESKAITATLPAGGCVVFSGTVVHRGGANRSAASRCAFSNQYCQPWARPQENFFLGVPTEVARAMPPRLQALLGYSIHPPFIGQLTASHPVKALEPGFISPVQAQAREAGAQLPG